MSPSKNAAAKGREVAAPPSALAAGESSPTWPNPILWIAPALAGLAAYWGSLRNGFVWDDPLVLLQLRAIRGVGDLFVLPRGIPRLYYRPVVFATYMVDRGLGGEQPFWFHASVVAWHLLNTVLVFFLARTLLRPVADQARPATSAATGLAAVPAADLFAAVAALLFAVHPAHVESVAWMAGRSDVIACAFVLAALLFFLRAGNAAAWASGASLLLALLTKEPVILVAGVLPLAEWSLGRPLRPGRYAAIAAAVALYLLLRSAGAGLLGEPTQPADAGVATVLAAIGVYVGKAFLPIGQTVFYDVVPVGLAYVLGGVAGIVALAAFFLWGARAKNPAVVVPIAWFAATLAPALILVLRRIGTTPVAERYVYIPSAGAVILISYVLLRLAQRSGRRGAVLALALLLALVGAVEVARRNHVWENDVYFWTAAAAGSTDATPQRELADALLRHGQADEAEAAYLVAMQRPGSVEERATTYSNLGNLYSRGPRVDEAIGYFQKAIELRPHPSFYHGLGLALMRKAERAQASQDARAINAAVAAAREAFEHAITLGSMPNAPSAFNQWQPAKTHLLLGQVLVAQGERDLARQHLELVLQLEPTGLTADTAKKYLTMVDRPPG